MRDIGVDAIEIRELTKQYASRAGAVTALDQISFAVGEGEFVAVVGPSGCGKSTLLKILAGLLPTSSGEARLRGTPIAGPRRDIGVVFQSPVLFPWRSVLDNVLLPVDVQRLGRDRYEKGAMDLLALVGLTGFEHRYPWELSGGMQQRVAHRARAGPRSRAAADGRAVRRARRDDPRAHEPRAAAHLAGAAARRCSSSPTRSPRRCSSATASS